MQGNYRYYFRPKKGRMIVKQKSKIRVLRLEGSPKERGRIHGETLKPMILEVLERYKKLLRIYVQKDPDPIIDFFLANTDFLTATKKWAPQLLEEIEGIAEGVGIDFKEIFAMHLAAHDEKWWFLQKSNISEHCSSLGCFREGNQPTLLAQNMDLNKMFEGLEVLLHIKYTESSLEAYVLSHAGFLAECGVNNQPVGICCNSLTSHLNNSKSGLPVTFIVRSVLEQPSLEKAVEFIHDIQHASGQNYIIGGSERVVCLECSANKVSQFEPHEGARRVYHTNHPLVNNDIINPPLKPHEIGTTFNRFNHLESQLRDSSKKITIETIKNILRSHSGPVCVHYRRNPLSGYTFSSVIYSLSTPPSLYITVGPPCSAEYEKFDF